MNEPSPHLKALLSAFDVSTLGNGDLAAGTNVLVAWATSIANLARPGSGIETNEGQLIEVGSDLLISGSLSNSLIQETDITPLTQYQDSLNSHIRKHIASAAKENEKQRPDKWSQLPELPACPSENVFFGLQHDPDNAFGSIEDNWQDVLNHPAGLTREETFTNSQVLFRTSQITNLERSLQSAHLGKPFVCLPISSPQDLQKGERLFSAVIDGFSVGDTLPKRYQGRLLLSDPQNSFSEVISKAQLSFVRLLWLHDGEQKPLLLEQAKGPAFKAAHLREEMARAFARRVNFHSQIPHLVAFDFAAIQEAWVTFLKTQEHLLPGIAGSAKNLLATLFYSIVELARNHPRVLNPKNVYRGVRDLAIFIVQRAASERSHVLETSLIEKDEGLKTRMLKHLEASPQLERNLYRSLSISATDCQRLLLDLQSEKLIQRDDTSGSWSFATNDSRQPVLEAS